MTAPRRLLLVHAHPDDESINSATTMARYVAEGAAVTLVTCTLGELGEILAPQFAGLAADRGDQLGGYRLSELARAMTVLGVHDYRFLGGAGGWRDSGMMGTPGNDDPRAFWRCASDRAAFDRAVAELVEVIVEVRPQVLVTYDDHGGYGHPDHIMAHRVALAAVDRAAVEPVGGGQAGWAVAKIYYATVSRALLQRVIDAAQAAGDDSPFGVDRADELPFGHDDDESITTLIDGTAWTSAKIAALRAHRTQIDDAAPFFAISRYLGDSALGQEYFRLARGELGSERDANGLEVDLFAGVVGT